jgi:hypothetical protein
MKKLSLLTVTVLTIMLLSSFAFAEGKGAVKVPVKIIIETEELDFPQNPPPHIILTITYTPTETIGWAIANIDADDKLIITVHVPGLVPAGEYSLNIWYGEELPWNVSGTANAEGVLNIHAKKDIDPPEGLEENSLVISLLDPDGDPIAMCDGGEVYIREFYVPPPPYLPPDTVILVRTIAPGLTVPIKK